MAGLEGVMQTPVEVAVQVDFGELWVLIGGVGTVEDRDHETLAKSSASGMGIQYTNPWT